MDALKFSGVLGRLGYAATPTGIIQGSLIGSNQGGH